MKKVILKTVIRRFLEIFFWEVVLSVVVTALTTAEGDTSKQALVGITVMGMFVYILINVLFQRRCCMDLADKRMYYKTNFSAYALFIVVNLVCTRVLNNEQYTWMFSMTKAARYLYEILPTTASAVCFHILMLVAVYFSPYGMDELLHVVREGRRHTERRSRSKDEDEEEEWFNIPEDRRRIID